MTIRNHAYLVFLAVAAGCGSSSNNNNDARVGDSAVDRADAFRADTADARVSDSATPDIAQSDGATVPDGARDVAPPVDTGIRDTGADVSDARVVDSAVRLDTVTVDQSTIDSATRDAPAIDTSGLDTAAVEGGSVDGTAVVTFVATLSGPQEVPAVPTAATGSATFALSTDRTQLTYHVTHNVTGGTASHIHLGAPGESGGIIYPLTPFSTDMSGTLTITPTDAANLDQGLCYVNVHSGAYPNGEIRGQILHPGETLWVASLTGAQETPPVVSSSTGHASVMLDATQTNVRYHVATTGLTLTGARIQNAIATMSGPMVYQLTPLAAIIDGTTPVTVADTQNLADRHWYVNVQTATNPDGELRGQLLQPGETLYSASLSGANEVPPVTTTATGGAQFILDATTGVVRYEEVLSGLTATASRIYLGPAGTVGSMLYALTLTPGGAKGSQALTTDDLVNLNAGLFYANVLTAAAPNGEIRGQIVKQ